MPGMSKSARKATVMMLNQIEIQPPTWKGPVIHKMGVERHPNLIRRLWRSVSPLPPQPGSRCPWPAPSRSASKTRSSCFPEGVGYRRTPMKYKNWTFEGLGLIWNLLNSAIRKPWRQPESRTVWSRWRLGWGRGRQPPHWATKQPNLGKMWRPKVIKLQSPTKNSLSFPLKASAALATRMAAMVLAKVKKIRAKTKTRTKTNQISQPNSIGNQPDQGGPDAQVVDPVLSQALTVHADLCQVHHLIRALVIQLLTEQ